MDSGTKFSQLTSEEMEEFLSFKNTPVYKLILRITMSYLSEQALSTTKVSGLGLEELGKQSVLLMGTRVGFNYILELPDKSSKELEKRKKLKEKKEVKVKPGFYNNEL